MSETFNIYCDESCHLENDNQKAMVLGAGLVPAGYRHGRSPSGCGRSKQKHGLPPHFEVKWTKVSPAGKALYLDLARLFFR